MARDPLTVREAVLDDVEVLERIWAEELQGDTWQRRNEAAAIVERCGPEAAERVLVAVAGEQVVGLVLLRVGSISPFNPDQLVQLFGPLVLPEHRRRGVGRLLIDAAVSLAEEQGIGYVGAVAHTASRESNRFLARLGLAPQVTLRMAPTGTIRQKLTAQIRIPRTPARGMPLGQVLAARRSQRRG